MTELIIVGIFFLVCTFFVGFLALLSRKNENQIHEETTAVFSVVEFPKSNHTEVRTA